MYPNVNWDIPENTVLYRNYDSSFDKLLSGAKIQRKIGVNIKICNGYVYACDEDNNSISLKIDSNQRPNNIDKLCQNYAIQMSKMGESDFYLLNIEIDKNNLMFLPISQINELRRILLQNLMKLRVKNYKKSYQKPIHYADFPVKNLDYKANVLNDSALNFYRRCNSNIYEMAVESAQKVPQGIELMRSKHCLRYAVGICSKFKKYERKLYLVDEHGKKYPLSFDCKNCEMIVNNP